MQVLNDSSKKIHLKKNNFTFLTIRRGKKSEMFFCLLPMYVGTGILFEYFLFYSCTDQIIFGIVRCAS